MASRDGRPEVLGFKIDECPTCHGIGPHVLTETVEPATWGRRTTSYRLVCTRCAASVSIDASAARSAARSGELPIQRDRPGFGALAASGPPTAPPGTALASPYASGDADAFVAERLSQARTALSAGADGAAVQRELFDQFVPNPNARRASAQQSASRGALIAVIGVLLLLGFVAFLFLIGGPDALLGSRGSTANASPTPTPRPTATPRPTPTPTPQPSLLPADRLASVIPPAIRASCRELADGVPQEAIAALRCRDETSPPTSIDYFLFRDASRTDQAFTAEREAVNITEQGRACFEGRARQYSPYGYGDPWQEAGRVTCYRRQNQPHALWSHIDNHVLARARRSEGTPQDLMTWWLTGAPGPCDGACD